MSARSGCNPVWIASYGDRPFDAVSHVSQQFIRSDALVPF